MPLSEPQLPDQTTQLAQGTSRGLKDKKDTSQACTFHKSVKSTVKYTTPSPQLNCCKNESTFTPSPFEQEKGFFTPPFPNPIFWAILDPPIAFQILVQQIVKV